MAYINQNTVQGKTPRILSKDTTQGYPEDVLLGYSPRVRHVGQTTFHMQGPKQKMFRNSEEQWTAASKVPLRSDSD